MSLDQKPLLVYATVQPSIIVMPKLSDPRLLQALVPTWAVDKIGSALGLDGAMKNFDPKQANSVISQIGKRALPAAKSRL